MSTLRLITFLSLLGLTLAPAATVAQEQKGELTVALYAPMAPLPSADARFGYVDKLARYLQSVGVNAHPKVFARSADLETAIKRGQVDLAILDAFYAADRGSNFQVLAVATAAGELYSRWGLYTHLSNGNILDMSGKRLAWVSPSGAKEASYINNVLLYGELKVAQFFQMSSPTPDIGAAVSDVVLRRADCVFAPEPAVQGKSLRRVYDAGDAGRIPNPALVQVQGRLSDDVIANIKRSIVGFNTTGVLDGWRAGGGIGEAYRQLRQRLRGRPDRNLVFAEPQRLNTQVNSTMVASSEMTPISASLRSMLLPPTDLP
jgi:hypothetical protein